MVAVGHILAWVEVCTDVKAVWAQGPWRTLAGVPLPLINTGSLGGAGGAVTRVGSGAALRSVDWLRSLKDGVLGIANSDMLESKATI